MLEFIKPHTVNQGIGLIAHRRKKTEICPKQYREDKRFHGQIQAHRHSYCDGRHYNCGCIIAYHSFLNEI